MESDTQCRENMAFWVCAFDSLLQHSSKSIHGLQGPEAELAQLELNLDSLAELFPSRNGKTPGVVRHVEGHDHGGDGLCFGVVGHNLCRPAWR